MKRSAFTLPQTFWRREVPFNSKRTPACTISKQINKALSLEASVAAEQYHSPVWDKWHVYPTLNALWNINDNHLLNLSFSSDSEYPSYWSIMSNVFYSSTYTEIHGNPDLKPCSYYNLSLMWQIKRRYTLMAFASLKPDYSVQLPYQPTDRMAVILKETNFNYENSFGLHPELNIPCEADLLFPYIRLSSVLPFLQNQPCARVFHLSLYTASFLTAIGMRYYHVPIAHSLKAWLSLSGQRGTDVLHRPIR